MNTFLQIVVVGADKRVAKIPGVGRKHVVVHREAEEKSIENRTFSMLFSGRGRRLRTLGLRFWGPPLYQLSYSPI